MTRTVKCEECGRSNATLCERTNPRDYSVSRLRLCQRCRTRYGLKSVQAAMPKAVRT